jgi:hypothetical protein
MFGSSVRIQIYRCPIPIPKQIHNVPRDEVLLVLGYESDPKDCGNYKLFEG